MNVSRRVGAICGLCIVVRLGTANAGTGISVEAVNNYSLCNGGSLTRSIADVDGFRSRMQTPFNWANYWLNARWVDSNVWTSDFYDPNATGLADDDVSNFDQNADAFSYYAGHGACSAVGVGDSGQYCTSGSTCNSPPAGNIMPGFCHRLPGDYFGVCAYTAMLRILAVGNCTSGPAGRGGLINYSTGGVRLGESTTAGGWGGAGTNGGTNVAVIHASCAELSWRGQEIFPAFAGLHILETVLVHSGDTANISDRGYNFASRYQTNPNGSVGTAWTDAMNSNGDRNNFCSNFFQNQS